MMNENDEDPTTTTMVKAAINDENQAAAYMSSDFNFLMMKGLNRLIVFTLSFFIPSLY
jgi:hypothetical protein